MFLLYSSPITSREIFAAMGLLSLSMVYMKFCNVCNTHMPKQTADSEQIKFLYYTQSTTSVMCTDTYCVDLVVFVLRIDVFDIRNNVCVQRLWRQSTFLIR